MTCKWLSDDFSAICVNADCPACADACPCLNWPQICRHAEFTPSAPDGAPPSQREAVEDDPGG